MQDIGKRLEEERKWVSSRFLKIVPEIKRGTSWWGEGVSMITMKD